MLNIGVKYYITDSGVALALN